MALTGVEGAVGSEAADLLVGQDLNRAIRAASSSIEQLEGKLAEEFNAKLEAALIDTVSRLRRDLSVNGRPASHSTALYGLLFAATDVLSSLDDCATAALLRSMAEKIIPCDPGDFMDGHAAQHALYHAALRRMAQMTSRGSA